jgi:hypothetical protein
MIIRPKDLKKSIKEKEILFEMSNLLPKSTGLPVTVWVQGQTEKEKHWARVKLEYKGELIPVTISDDPQIKGSKTVVPASILSPVKRWIVINKDFLMKFWNDKGQTLDSTDLKKQLTKIK